jgi:hypothetical protein
LSGHQLAGFRLNPGAVSINVCSVFSKLVSYNKVLSTTSFPTGFSVVFRFQINLNLLIINLQKRSTNTRNIRKNTVRGKLKVGLCNGTVYNQ